MPKARHNRKIRRVCATHSSSGLRQIVLGHCPADGIAAWQSVAIAKLMNNLVEALNRIEISGDVHFFCVPPCSLHSRTIAGTAPLVLLKDRVQFPTATNETDVQMISLLVVAPSVQLRVIGIFRALFRRKRQTSLE